jgi:T-complex protein 11
VYVARVVHTVAPLTNLQALEQISSPSPEIQLPRIKVFYQDLFDALRPFISPNHPVMVALRSPLPPSSNPLLSALNYLKSSLALMRTVCAPVRDHAIDETIRSIDSLDELHASTEELAKAYTFGIKFALDMSNTLIEDYQGAMSKFGDNSRIAAMFRGSAREHERDTFLAAFGEEKLKRSWKEWQQSSSTSPSHWTNKLVDVVSTLDPVMSSQEILPPILRMNRLDIAESQSLLLGLLVAASLRTLVPPLPAGRQALLYRDDKVALQVEAQFMERLWAIIGADPYTADPTQQASIENMASEVIHLYKQRNPGIPTIAAKEKELNDMVARMIDDEAHPVRVLLKKRVTNALKERLSHPIVPLEHDIPTTVTAGRSMKPVVRLKPGKVFAAEQMEADLVIPGFSDPVLKSQLRQILHMLRIVQGWVEYVWNDIYTT